MTITNLILKSDYSTLDEQGKKYYNAALVMEYPWILKKEDRTEDYDFSWNFFDLFPKGWIKAFMKDMCEEINAAYNKLTDEQKEDFEIIEQKEKWGRMIIEFYPYTDDLLKISEKYFDLSATVCQKCGAPATKVTKGWIGYYCDEHATGEYSDLSE